MLRLCSDTPQPISIMTKRGEPGSPLIFFTPFSHASIFFFCCELRASVKEQSVSPNIETFGRATLLHCPIEYEYWINKLFYTWEVQMLLALSPYNIRTHTDQIVLSLSVEFPLVSKATLYPCSHRSPDRYTTRCKKWWRMDFTWSHWSEPWHSMQFNWCTFQSTYHKFCLLESLQFETACRCCL